MADKEGSDAGNGKKGYRLLTPAESAENAEEGSVCPCVPQMEVIFCCFSERDMKVYQSIV